jgi:hypothetical protein
VQSAWVKRRRRRYFIGPYNETRELTVIAPGPYCVLPDSASCSSRRTTGSAATGSRRPERYWHRLDGPSAAELGEACVAAFERSTA